MAFLTVTNTDILDKDVDNTLKGQAQSLQRVMHKGEGGDMHNMLPHSCRCMLITFDLQQLAHVAGDRQLVVCNRQSSKGMPHSSKSLPKTGMSVGIPTGSPLYRVSWDLQSTKQPFKDDETDVSGCTERSEWLTWASQLAGQGLQA